MPPHFHFLIQLCRQSSEAGDLLHHNAKHVHRVDVSTVGQGVKQGHDIVNWCHDHNVITSIVKLIVHSLVGKLV